MKGRSRGGAVRDGVGVSGAGAIFLLAAMVAAIALPPNAAARNDGQSDEFGTSLNDSAQGLALDGRTLYAYGRTAATLPGQTTAGSGDLYLRKYDVQGNVVWTMQFGTAGDDNSFFGTIAAREGRVVVGGQVRGALPGQTYLGLGDSFLRGYDADGNVLWTRQYGTSKDDAIRQVVLDEDGFIYVAGQTDGIMPGQTGAGGRDALVEKFDGDGNPVWTVQFGSPAREEAIGLTVHGAAVFATGVTTGALPGQSNAGGTDGFVIKLAADDGRVEWLTQFGTAGDDSPWKVRILKHAIFVGGHTTGDLGAPNLGETDPFLLRMGPIGDIEWVRQFGTAGVDFQFPITVHQDAIALAGVVRGALPGQTFHGVADFYVREYDVDGNELWTNQWGTPALDSLTEIAALGADLYVSGASAGSLPGFTNVGQNDAVVMLLPRDTGGAR